MPSSKRVFAETVLCVFWLVFLWLVVTHGQDGGEPGTESPRAALGLSVPEPVGTQGDVHLLTRDGGNAPACSGNALTFSGAVTQTDSEIEQRTFELAGLVLMAPRHSLAEMALRDLRFSGKTGRLIFVPDPEKPKR